MGAVFTFRLLLSGLGISARFVQVVARSGGDGDAANLECSAGHAVYALSVLATKSVSVYASMELQRGMGD